MELTKKIKALIAMLSITALFAACNINQELNSDDSYDSSYSDYDYSDNDDADYDYSDNDDSDYYSNDDYDYDDYDYEDYNYDNDDDTAYDDDNSSDTNIEPDDNVYSSLIGSTDGLTFNGTVIVNDTVFEDNAIAHTSTTKISDNQAVIAYADTVNKKGNYVVVNSDGQTIGTVKTFCNQEVFSASVIKLNNNNVLIAYDNNEGKTIVLNPLTGEVFSASVFANTKTARIRTAKLSNGNIIIAYIDKNNNNKSAYVICDSNGNVVNSPVILSTSAVYNLQNYMNIDVAVLQNGSAIIIYTEEGNDNYGVYAAIISNTGQLIEKKLVENIRGGHLSVVAMSEGGAVLSYNTDTKSKFAYYKHSTNTFTGPYERWLLTGGLNNTKQGIALTLHQNDFIIYADAYMCYIMDKYGRQTAKFSRITLPNIEYISAVTFSDGKVLFVFNFSNSNQGKFVIMN